MTPDISLELLNSALPGLRRLADGSGIIHMGRAAIAGHLARHLECSEERALQVLRVLRSVNVVTGPHQGVELPGGARVEQWELLKPRVKIVMRGGYIEAIDERS